MKKLTRFIVLGVYDHFITVCIDGKFGVYTIPIDKTKDCKFKKGNFVTISIKKVKL